MVVNIYMKKVFRLIRNKYVLSLLVFFLWLLFFDSNSLLDRFAHKQRIGQLQDDKVYYSNKIEETRERIKELKTDEENLEKFAREQYLMKEDDEDLFIIVRE